MISITAHIMEIIVIIMLTLLVLSKLALPVTLITIPKTKRGGGDKDND